MLGVLYACILFSRNYTVMSTVSISTQYQNFLSTLFVIFLYPVDQIFFIHSYRKTSKNCTSLITIEWLLRCFTFVYSVFPILLPLARGSRSLLLMIKLIIPSNSFNIASNRSSKFLHEVEDTETIDVQNTYWCINCNIDIYLSFSLSVFVRVGERGACVG